MKRGVLTAVLLVSAAMSSAQISDAEALEIGDRVLQLMGAEERVVELSLSRETISSRRGSKRTIWLRFGSTNIILSEDGRLLSYGDLGGYSSKPDDGSEEKYKTDEEAWIAVELLLSNFAISDDVERSSLVRMDQDNQPYSMRLSYSRNSAFGYPVNGGNRVSVELDRMSGKVTSFSHASGWTYEEPRVALSEAEALEVALSEQGGERSDWSVKLFYSTPVSQFENPELDAMYRDKKMRLIYQVNSIHGTAEVDSVTGELLGFYKPMGHAAESPEPSSNQVGATKQEVANKPEDVQAKPGDGQGKDGDKPRLLIYGGIGAGLLILTVIAVRLFGKR